MARRGYATLPVGSTASGQSNTADNLVVSEVLPQGDSTQIQGNSVITVIFNRPIIPLETVEDTAKLPHPLEIQPAIEGKGAWLNTSVYIFHPTGYMSPNTRYTVTVKSGLTSSDGLTLTKPYQWSFTTQAAQILQIVPNSDYSSVLLDPDLMIYFNQPVNRAQAEAQFYLHALGQAVPVNFAALPTLNAGDNEQTTSASLSTTPRPTATALLPPTLVPNTPLPPTPDMTRESIKRIFWEPDSMIVTFKPDHQLELNTKYEFGINSKPDGLELTSETRSTFTTVPLPDFVCTTPKDGTKDVYGSGAVIGFVSPMDKDSFKGKITVEPKPILYKEYYLYNAYQLLFPVNARTRYTLTIAPCPKDIYGNVVTTQVPFFPHFKRFESQHR